MVHAQAALLPMLLATAALGCSVLARRVAGLRRALAEVGCARDLTDAMIGDMREVIFRTDADGRWVFLNPAWEALTGHPVEHSLGRRSSDLLLLEDRLAAARDLHPRLISGELTDAILNQRFHDANGVCRDV